MELGIFQVWNYEREEVGVEEEELGLLRLGVLKDSIERPVLNLDLWVSKELDELAS